MNARPEVTTITHEDTTGFAPASECWCAYMDSYDGSPGQHIGKGATEAEAIADLQEQLDSEDDVPESPLLRMHMRREYR